MAETTFPKHRVLSWPAVPTPTPDEVYAGLSDQAKAYPLSLETMLRQTENFKKPENLTTVRVLDLSKGMIIGNWCSSMLSELGADTIKCEPPEGGNVLHLTFVVSVGTSAWNPPFACFGGSTGLVTNEHPAARIAAATPLSLTLLPPPEAMRAIAMITPTTPSPAKP